MARHCSIAAFLIAAALLAGACTGESQADDQPPDDATTSTAPQACSPGATQASNRFVADELAERLPPPPPGARVCRFDPRTRTTVYDARAIPTPGREILEYYGPALRQSDCDTEAIEPAGSDLAYAGDASLPFACPEGRGSVVAPKEGGTYAIAWQDEG